MYEAGDDIQTRHGKLVSNMPSGKNQPWRPWLKCKVAGIALESSKIITVAAPLQVLSVNAQNAIYAISPTLYKIISERAERAHPSSSVGFTGNRYVIAASKLASGRFF